MLCIDLFFYGRWGRKRFLFFRKICGAALIHLAAVFCTVEQHGKDTHITHLGRTTAEFTNFLDNAKYTFLVVRISRRLVAGWQLFGMGISSRIQNLILFQPL